MGARESRASILSYDEAIKRVTTTELDRIQEAYKRACGYAGLMREATFLRDVLGDNVPTKLSQRIFAVMSAHSKGMTFRELFVTLVLLTRGRHEERLKLTYAVYCDEQGSTVTSKSMSNMIFVCEKTALPHEALPLFKGTDHVTYDQFRSWVLTYPHITSVTRWLVNTGGITISLTDNKDMPNFYQTLAGVTHLEESDITELEKCYWKLKSQSKTGRFDLVMFKSLVCPPVPEILVEGLFNAFDENKDGHIDFKEISCGVSACCRGPLAERQKFCYKIFDKDQDNKLNEMELKGMAVGLLDVQQANKVEGKQTNQASSNSKDNDQITAIVNHVLKHSINKNKFISLEEYQLWSLQDPLPTVLLNVIIEVCHIVLGLRPSTPQDEGTIVRGWLHRSDQQNYHVGETWYVVSGKWWTVWKKYTQFDSTLSVSNEDWEQIADDSSSMSHSSSSDTVGLEAKEVMPHTMPPDKTSKNRQKSQGKGQSGGKRPFSISSLRSTGSPGPINNSDIVEEENTKIGTLTDEGCKLKENLRKGEDYVILPDPMWRALFHWYGGSPVLPRIVPAAHPDEKPWLELHRLHLVILRHQLPSSMQQLSQMAFTGSGTLAGVGNTTLGVLKQTLNYFAGGNTPRRQATHRATFSRRHTVGQVSIFLSQRLRIPLENMRLWHLLDENNANLLEDESQKLEAIGISNGAEILLEVRNMDMSWPEELSQIARNHKLKNKQEDEPKQVTLGGTTGLSNLGNTCFMNSSLQCISNTQPLTKYFLEDKHLFELNRTNPLGMKGHIAKRYSDLVHDLWSGSNKTIAPLKVRWTISKHASQFNGFSQHDSQEFVAFLLDGLHEDLNRVHEKPYVELEDSGGRPDEEVAQEAWENHLSRNQSIIIDLFHGQIKSQVRCMECNTISVRFDPFTFLSLPLPMDNLMYFDVIVIRLDGKAPTRYGLRLSMDDTFLEVRKHLAENCKLDIEAMLLVEVVGATVKSFLSDNLKVKTSAMGNLYAYEIPPPKQAGIVTNHAQPMLPASKIPNGGVNGMHHSNASTNTTQQQDQVAPYPSHIGSSVHETSKRSITNRSALHIAPTSNGSEEDGSLIGTDFKSKSSSNEESRSSQENSAEMQDNIPRNRSTSSLSTFYVNSLNGNDSVLNPTQTSSSHSMAEDFSSINYPGYVVAYHRKIFHLDVYFLSSQKHRPNLFGLPIVVPCLPGQSRRMLYNAVWKLVSRLVSPLPPSEGTTVNHAQDCDQSLGSQFPFTLRSVRQCGLLCGNSCPWFRFCKGCLIQCDDEVWKQSSEYIAIDWDATALHLRYQTSAEKEMVDDASVEEGHKGQQQRIDLDYCLKAFTSEEELGKDELYKCGKCDKLQVAKKKLDIWRLPPVLIIHLKRFRIVNGRWIKSHKVVDFPKNDFDPSHFMTERVTKKTLGEINQTPMEDDVVEEAKKSDDEHSKSKQLHITFSNEAGGDGDLTTKAVNGSEKSPDGDAQKTNVEKVKEVRKGGPARRRQPSFRENSPLYDLYAMSCHSGILGGGHYIAYARNKHNNKWYCYNDSSCKEVSPENISMETAYMLFYQRKGLDYDDFMPLNDGRTPVDTASMDEDYNSDLKKNCIIQ
ncbi:unnamed protein product [Clavelina lepadiformis]|uniref:ubiquitinyl hydrolase 1 n=1 Tax=Clavelina lepadiformis TaxID=159417 RepID=A0ABP0F178_CLALP